MGLACPVCEVPHPDGEHLADHVAITATTRGGDHRAWLDDQVPDWRSMNRTELGERVADRAEEVDSIDLHEEIGDHDRADGRGHAVADARGDLDEETRAILAEARRMTEERPGDDGEE